MAPNRSAIPLLHEVARRLSIRSVRLVEFKVCIGPPQPHRYTSGWQMLYVVGGVFGWVQALRVGKASKLWLAPFSSGTFYSGSTFTTPRSRKTYAPESAALRSGGAYVHRGSTNRVARIDRFGQVRGVRG